MKPLNEQAVSEIWSLLKQFYNDIYIGGGDKLKLSLEQILLT